MKKSAPFRARWKTESMLVLALLASSALLSATPVLRELNRRIGDGYFRIQPKSQQDGVVVVSIDDASLQEVGRWPWSRSKLAELVRAVAAQKPSVIGIDILLSEQQSPEEDAALRDAIAAAGNVVLVDKIASFPDGARWIEPLPALAGAAAGVGHAQAVLDGDGVCRSFPPVELSLAGPRNAFSLEVAERIDPAKTSAFLSHYGLSNGPAQGSVVVARPALIPIAFRRNPSATVSAAEVVAGRTTTLRNKVVLIGFGAVEIGDRITTPVSHLLPTPGVEVHAEIVDAILRERALQPLPTPLAVGLLLLVCVVAVHVFRKWRGWKTVPALLVLIAALYAAGYVAFLWLGRMLSIGTPAISMVLAPLLIYGVDLAVVEGSMTRQMRLLQQWLAYRSEAQSSGMDITWRLRVLTDLQQELGLRFELYRTLLEATRDLVAVFDTDGKLLFANKSFESAWGTSVPQSLAEVRRRIVETREAPLRENGAMTEGEATIQGTLYAVRLVPLPTTSLTPQGGTLLSMTSLHLRVERDRAREESLGFVTHELRTPLVAIQGFAEMMTRMPNAAASAGAPETILRESRRLLALINSYLDVLRTDAGARPLRMERVAVDKLIVQVFELLSPLAKASSISLALSCDPGISVQADEPLLTGAILNLVSNAIKYGPRGSEVHASVEIAGSDLQIAIHNSGDPIAEGESVFEPFVRGAREPAQPGWGLGLPLVKRIIEKHAGVISVESSADSGTTFTLRMPGAVASVGVSSP
jgi:CHASE2 domain-containing sensor protein/nitrogen-specific signal transduction histidine kinase